MNKIALQVNLNQLYFISFIEGGVVMVAEIAGAKMLTPFFGASLYSWAATLSITLFALMTGYYYGGYVTTKPWSRKKTSIPTVFLFSGLTVFLMPSLSHFTMQKTISLSFFSGLLISEFSFLFLPIFLMGMISPMIIFRITEKAEQSGRSAGNIYAISTSGGILFTLVFGFFIVPYFGISLPVRLLGLIVASLGCAFILKDRITRNIVLILVVLSTVTAVGFNKAQTKKRAETPSMRLVASSEGLMGELKVIDQLSYPPNSEPFFVRRLKINNIEQNEVVAALPTQSLLYYVNFTKQLLSFFPKKGPALLIGLGAGSLYKILREQYVTVETVEIDKRMYDIGVQYFGMDAHKDNFTTDGRYYINVTKKRYDLVVVDAIVGENVPAQLTTIESFKRLYAILNENGALVIENGGLYSFSDNSFVPSIVKTLEAAGFYVRIFNPLLSDNVGDAVFVATKRKFETGNFRLSDDIPGKGRPLADYLLPVTAFENTGATIFTDDLNKSDIILKSHYFHVRKSIRKELAKYQFWE